MAAKPAEAEAPEAGAAAMIVKFCPENGSWACTLGDALIDVEGQTIYENRQEIVSALRRSGWDVRNDGLVLEKK